MARIELDVILADGTEHRITPTLEDTLAYETTLRKNKSWGPLADNILKMQPFRAWNFLRRTGATELTWEQFTTGDTAAIAVDLHSDTEEDDAAGDDLEVDGVGKDTPTAALIISSLPSPSTPASHPQFGPPNTPTI